jgi:hypothetical protein
MWRNPTLAMGARISLDDAVEIVTAGDCGRDVHGWDDGGHFFLLS